MKPSHKIALISGLIVCSFAAYRLPWLIYEHGSSFPPPCPADKTSAQACINNLRQIDAASQQFSQTNQSRSSGTNMLQKP
jgi:hypothetical protein